MSCNKDILLPAPRKTGGMPLMEALAARRSARDFTDEDLPLQTLSDLLWAAWGHVSPRRRTAPSSHNRQETTLYIFLRSGVYVYDAEEHALRLKIEEDLRALTGTQEFVGQAPLNIVFVADPSLLIGKTPQGIIETVYADSAFISQNIYLFCASESLAGVIRVMLDKEALAQRLALPEHCIVTMAHSVGYPAERK